jgi:hypothetical protein
MFIKIILICNLLSLFLVVAQVCPAFTGRLLYFGRIARTCKKLNIPLPTDPRWIAGFNPSQLYTYFLDKLEVWRRIQFWHISNEKGSRVTTNFVQGFFFEPAYAKIVHKNVTKRSQTC